VVEAAQILGSMGEQNKLEGVNQALCILEHEVALVLDALREVAKSGRGGSIAVALIARHEVPGASAPCETWPAGEPE
jgi:hypothetical protein